MFSKAQKIDGRNQGARFGTAVVAVGDLDKDTFAGKFCRYPIAIQNSHSSEYEDYSLLGCDAK
jgi:hypothetical protein